MDNRIRSILAARTIRVVGDRASLAAAEQTKRDTIGIAASVDDDDIARLPDLNVTEALQRITGIQIPRAAPRFDL